MLISREWCMPNKWTFKMPPVAKLLEKYKIGYMWVDPFAGENSPAQFTNDIREDSPAQFHMDALEFLRLNVFQNQRGVLFDPPYSVEQCLRHYTPKHGGTAGMAEYWAKCKDEIAKIVAPGGHVISFAWDSNGEGKKRGFEIEEILLLCHGACHNDTIVTVERKNDA